MGLTQITTGGVDDNINIDSNTLKVDGTNNRVGIGSSSPLARLEVTDDSQSDVTAGDLVVDTTGLSADVLVGRLSGRSNDNTTFRVRNRVDATTLICTGGGNVGIGVTSPQQKQHIHVDSSGASVTQYTNSTTGSAVGDGFLVGLDSTEDGLVFVKESKDLIFGTSNAERMRIKSDGKIGFNTINPPRDYCFHSGQADTNIQITNNTTGVDDSAGSLIQQDGNNLYIWDKENGFFSFGTNASERMRIDNSGRVGIGTTSPSSLIHGEVSSGAATLTLKSTATSGEASVSITGKNSSGTARTAIFKYDNADLFRIGTSAGIPLRFETNDAERMRIDSSGRVGIKNSSPGSQYFNDLVIGDGSGDHGITLHTGSSNSSSIAFSDATSGSGRYAGYLQYDHNDNSMKFYTNGGNERMRIVSTGYAQFGGYLVETNNHRINGINDNQGDTILVVSGYQSSGGSSQDTAMFYAVSSGGSVSQSGAGLRMYRNTSTNRSINTAGTINASGADYAEYMTKAGDFTLAKGDICGINSEGKLTNVFADAISFVVKSTDPSYVGGDTWHTAAGEKPGGYDDDRTEEEIAAATVAYEEALEAARQLVDRIAFSGQVPVNVTGATPGQHIIPTAAADGSIEGTAKAEADLTMAEYMSSVGKVIAIEDDGRAKIIVKVA